MLKVLDKPQAGLARALDIDPASVCMILGGKRKVQLEEVHALAGYLELSDYDTLKKLGMNI